MLEVSPEEEAAAAKAKAPKDVSSAHWAGRPPRPRRIRQLSHIERMFLEAEKADEVKPAETNEAIVVTLVAEAASVHQEVKIARQAPRSPRLRQMESSDLDGLFAQAAKLEDRTKSTTNKKLVEEETKNPAEQQFSQENARMEATPIPQYLSRDTVVPLTQELSIAKSEAEGADSSRTGSLHEAGFTLPDFKGRSSSVNTATTTHTGLSGDQIPSVIYIQRRCTVPNHEPLELLLRVPSIKKQFLKRLRNPLRRSNDSERLSELDNEAFEHTLVQI